MNDEREYQPDFPEALANNRRLWKFALITPIMYLLLGQLIVALDWFDPSPETPRPYDTPLTQTIFLLAAAAIVVALAVLVWRRTRLPQAILADPGLAVGRWTRNFYIHLSLCDSFAFIGLFYYILSAKVWALFAGGAAAYLTYLLVYPRESDSEALGQ